LENIDANTGDPQVGQFVGFNCIYEMVSSWSICWFWFHIWDGINQVVSVLVLIAYMRWYISSGQFVDFDCVYEMVYIKWSVCWFWLHIWDDIYQVVSLLVLIAYMRGYIYQVAQFIGFNCRYEMVYIKLLSLLVLIAYMSYIL